MFRPGAYENSRPDGIGVLEIVDGAGVDEGSPRRFVPLKRTELKGEIVGPLASLRMTQVYGYSREVCDQVLETVYRFPLPGDAAVTAVRVRFGSVEIRTELKERSEAEAAYGEALRQGRQAALVSRESPDVFTLRVAGIQPDQEVLVETSYVQLARAEGTGWSLRVPLTTSPRYVRADETTSRHAHGQPLLLLRDPGHRFSLDVELLEAGSVSSPTHPLDQARKEDRVRISLREGEVLPDRDFVLSWQPRQEKDLSSFHVWLDEDRTSGQVYFLALVAPPAVPDPAQGIPREIILLVDHSGSMSGPKWAAADWVVKKFLSELTERDTFTLGLFHNETRWFSRTVGHADTARIADAIRFLESHRDSGGTELGVALEQALHLPRTASDEPRARHVLVITDAEVSDTARILQLADEEAKRKDRRRISTLCIDAAPNAFLAMQLAERGGGVARFLTSDPAADDISTALDEVLADWSQPVLTGLRLEIDRSTVQAAGRDILRGGESGASLLDLADLPAGRAIWVAGRVPRGERDDLAFRVLAPPQREVKARRLSLTHETHTRPALKALFGARRLLELELAAHSGGVDLIGRLGRLGYDLETVLTSGTAERPKVYVENRQRDIERALWKLLVEESLMYGLICAETAFVAVRTEQGKPVEETVVVANALPAGWSEDFLNAGLARLQLCAAVPQATAQYAKLGAPLQRRTMPTRAGRPPSGRMTGTAGLPPRAAQAEPEFLVLFAGVPRAVDGVALLFDSSRREDAERLRDGTTLVCLRVHFPEGAPDPAGLDTGLALLIFVDDLAQPRARVRLADLLRQGGERPLNLLRLPGQRVRIVLADPAGVWKDGGPPMEVALAVG
jgi:Ca-activated chloride channel homolog